jgi:hypothetical protein
MKPVVDPLPREQLITELSKDKLLRRTNNGNNEVYVFDNNTSPLLMREVGRVREITFRHAGGGTGKEIDIDDFDTALDDPQRQLIVWDPENLEIVEDTGFISLRKDVLIVIFQNLHHLHISIFPKNFLPGIIHILWNWAGHLFTPITSHAQEEGKACLPLIIFGMDLGQSLSKTIT